MFFFAVSFLASVLMECAWRPEWCHDVWRQRYFRRRRCFAWKVIDKDISGQSFVMRPVWQPGEYFIIFCGLWPHTPYDVQSDPTTNYFTRTLWQNILRAAKGCAAVTLKSHTLRHIDWQSGPKSRKLVMPLSGRIFCHWPMMMSYIGDVNGQGRPSSPKWATAHAWWNNIP